MTTKTSLQAVELTGFVDEHGNLTGLEPLQGLTPGEVRIIVLREAATANNGQKADYENVNYDASELSPEQWERGVSRLVAADFADDPEEDIYTREHGRPFDASQY